MAEYKITYEEHLVHHFYVEADSPEEAVDVFNSKNSNGEWNFSGGDLVDSEVTAEEVC